MPCFVALNQKINLESIFCIPRTPTDGFAEQNGRDAERADFLTLIYNI